jgi:drug/metabolite transporter (DMT)-like permease
VLYAGVLGSAGAIAVQTWAQARVPAVRAAIIFALEPVFAALFSVGLGRERLGRPELIGGALVVLGVLVAELGTSLGMGRPRTAVSEN